MNVPEPDRDAQPPKGSHAPPRVGGEEELYESRRLGFAPPQPEFDDEPPGAYLMGLRLGRRAAIWSFAQLVLVVFVALLGWYWKRTPEAVAVDFRAPLEVLWQFLGFAGFSAFLFCFFVRVNQASEGDAQSRLATRVVWTHLLALLVWVGARWGAGVGFYQAS